MHFVCYGPRRVLDEPLALDATGCRSFPVFSPNGPVIPKMLDIFAGSGAVSHALRTLGFDTIASVDLGELACQNLRSQACGITVQGDIQDPKVVELLHDTLTASGVEGFCIAAGFPCQPFSRQGMMSGSADARFGAFVGLISAVRFLKPKLLMLECVTQAGESMTIKQMLQELCENFGWVMRDVCLELGQQWPINRRRWYCVTSDPHNVPDSLPGWGIDPCRQTIGDVLPSFLSMTHPGMDELLLSELETECYSDPRLGHDKRQLTLDDKCNTILHSYGSPLQSCPCGCRQSGFAIASLVTKGLRGCFVIYPGDSRPRDLHADELRLLFALPPGMKLPENQKEALCLIGLIAAPLQVLWVMGNVLLAASKYDENIAPIDPSLILHEYKERILASTQPQAPSSLHLISLDQIGQPSWTCKVTHEATVFDLLRAERINNEWGHKVRAFEDSGEIPGFDLLLEHQHGMRIEHLAKKSKTDLHSARILLQFKIRGTSRIALLPRGSMLFEFFDQIDDQRPTALVNLTGDVVPLDTRIWFPGSYVAVDTDSFPCWPLLFQLEGKGISQNEPLTSGWYEEEEENYTSHLLEQQGLALDLFWTARWIVDTVEIWPHAAHQRILDKWAQGGFDQDRRFGILWEDFHWSAFLIIQKNGHLFVTILDSHKTEATAYMDLFFARVSRALSCASYTIQLKQGVGQSHGTHCGAVAVLNIAGFLDHTLHFSEQDAILLHTEILEQRSTSSSQLSLAFISPTLTWPMIGAGPDIQTQLAELIHQKGVPEEAKIARAQTILQRLGIPQVTKILADRNPWAALKSSASKPGVSLRILSEEEKNQYIEMRASTKHGASIKNHKDKKERAQASSSKTDVTDKLIPSQLVLDPKMFKDGNGDQIPQLQFSQVEADQHGLAICTLSEAAAFLNSPKSISPHALGLLMLEPPAPEVMQKAGAVKMRFPAQYMVTGEQVLIFGALLSIGDIDIDRATAGSVSKQPVLPTAIIKFTCYRDQYPGSWQHFTEAPVREILKMFEPLNYCDGKNCGSACNKTHPDVDHTYEAVILELWGRHYTAATGAKKTPKEADLFSFQVRVPAAIVLTLVSNNPTGLYSDPRTDDFRVSHPEYCVIWLNKAGFTQVEHLSRTCAFALSIARHRQRFGIRVKKSDEAKAWAQLKPDQHFQPVKIEQIYEVSPVPHGTRKKTMEKVMKEWNWPCRVLQPGRGSHFHMSWQVGAQEEPPARVMQAFQSDVLINPIRKVEVEALKPKIIVPQKTQQHFRQVNVNKPEGNDPWLNNNDPWAQYQASSSVAAPLPAPASTKRIEEIKGTLQQEVKEAIRKELQAGHAGEGMSDTASGRMDPLESSLQEVKSQNSAIKGWIQDAQTKLNRQEAQLTQLKQEVGAQSEQMKTQFSNLQGELNQSFEKQFSRLEALLEKRQGHE